MIHDTKQKQKKEREREEKKKWERKEYINRNLSFQMKEGSLGTQALYTKPQIAITK